ncbi:hypothetical protein GCM10010404_25020 [Nonomuraea africana]|uniref:DUF4178 domain-containing protein n=1 Tax=Nonomuraea africana TaxID=46171 RepID=A0ABR9KNH8_9ACTN|nr:DUF4178 domain-containing protein [Nonomuraea africana]MBE1563325.1 hypothetical protein [Nonomuraea africana]
MTSMVVIGLSIATVVIVLGGLYATMRKGRPPTASVSTLPTHDTIGSDYDDPRTIEVGDSIETHGRRAGVTGALHMSWQGRQWTEHLLDDGSRRPVWLSVEVRQGLVSTDPPHLEVLLWNSVPTQGMIPAKSMLIMEGVEFFPIERGTAAFRSEGETGRPERGLLDFADYRAADGRLLSFSRVQGEGWTASYAQPLPPGSITIVSRAA